MILKDKNGVGKWHQKTVYEMGYLCRALFTPNCWKDLVYTFHTFWPVRVWVSESVSVWVRECVSAWVCECVSVWVCECVSVAMCIVYSAWVCEYGSMRVWEYESMGVWEYGSMKVWKYECVYLLIGTWRRPLLSPRRAESTPLSL
jgi:hypothetical protein